MDLSFFRHERVRLYGSDSAVSENLRGLYCLEEIMQSLFKTGGTRVSRRSRVNKARSLYRGSKR